MTSLLPAIARWIGSLAYGPRLPSRITPGIHAGRPAPSRKCPRRIKPTSRAQEHVWCDNLERPSMPATPTLHPIQKPVDHRKEPLLLLDVRHVRAALEQHPFRASDAAVNLLHDLRRRLVIAARDQQRWHANLAQ